MRIKTLELQQSGILEFFIEQSHFCADKLDVIAVQVTHLFNDLAHFGEERLSRSKKRILQFHFDFKQLGLKLVNALLQFSLVVLVIELLVAVSCAFLLNPSVNVLFMLFIGLNLDDTFLLSLPFSISEHLLAVLLNVFLHPSFSLHFRLEFVRQLLDLALVHLIDIWEFHKLFESLQILVQRTKHSAKDISSAVDFGIDKLQINHADCIFTAFLAIHVIALTYLVFMLFVSLLSLLSFNQFVVNVFKLLESCNSVLFVFGGSRLLESVVRDSKHLELVFKFSQIVDAVF